MDFKVEGHGTLKNVVEKFLGGGGLGGGRHGPPPLPSGFAGPEMSTVINEYLGKS